MTRLEPEHVIDFVKECRETELPEPNEVFHIRDYEFTRPKDMDAPLIDVKLAPLVSRFDVKNLILLLSALMCEKRIIFIGNDLTTLSECIHAAVAILYDSIKYIMNLVVLFHGIIFLFLLCLLLFFHMLLLLCLS